MQPVKGYPHLTLRLLHYGRETISFSWNFPRANVAPTLEWFHVSWLTKTKEWNKKLEKAEESWDCSVSAVFDVTNPSLFIFVIDPWGNSHPWEAVSPLQNQHFGRHTPFTFTYFYGRCSSGGPRLAFGWNGDLNASKMIAEARRSHPTFVKTKEP